MSPEPSRIGVIIPTGLTDQLFSAADRRRLESLGQVRWWEGTRPPTPEQAARHLAECVVGVGSWGTPHPGSPGLLPACPRLRLWEHAAGTVKQMFGDHLGDRDLVIASAKGAIAQCVAELVVGELIVGLRHGRANAEANRAGSSAKPAGLRVLGESTVGVVGASEVGRRVMALLRPFGCRVLCVDPFADASTITALGARLVDDVRTLCAEVDAITLHTPLLPSTTGLLGARELATLRDGALVINTSRGECIEERALVAELSAGRLRAWLDVTAPEPAGADSPLRRLPNVALTSHIAGPACTLIGRRVVDDVAAFLSGGRPQCVVTADMLERIA